MTLDAFHLDLLETIKGSRAFSSHDRVYGELLDYLARHSARNQRDKRTEKQILEQHFIKRRKTETTPIPTLIKRLQDLLNVFFGTEAPDLPVKAYILRGPKTENHPDHYAVLFAPNDHSERYCRLFWRPHLTDHVRTHIAYGLPLFRRSANHEEFHRNIGENIDDLTTRGKYPKDTLCWPYVTLGDVLSTTELSVWLSKREVDVTSHRYRVIDNIGALKEKGKASDDDNVIVVGSTRVNGILKDYQARRPLHYWLDTHDVKVGDKVVCPETHESLCSIVPVIVSRMSGASSGTITMIAANHGAAVHKVAEVLTTEKALAPSQGGIFGHQAFKGWHDSWPETFQILLKLLVWDDETYTGRLTVLDAWVPSP